ncbi:MAG: hypothetical protein SGARI_001021 [Bacillariaceae sp.]
MVAYPGLWTGRQPDGSNTGEDFILIGTAEYHYIVVETDDTSYPAMRGGGHHQDHNHGNGDDHLYFATMNGDGRFLPTNLQVGEVPPDDPRYSQFLKPGMKEKRHAIHAQCVESDYCKWKKDLQASALSSSSVDSSSITISTGTVANVVVPFRFANHGDDSAIPTTPVKELDEQLFNGDQFSVKDYFSQQSYGKLDIVSEIVPWVTISYTEQECAHAQSGLSNVLHVCLEAALQEAVKVLDNLGDLLNAPTTTLTFVHSGQGFFLPFLEFQYAAEFGGNDISGVWYEDRIWSHAWELDSTLYQGRYAIISDKYDRKNNHINRVGVAVHELAQVLGAPTMHLDFPGYGLGYFDVMSNPCKL